MFLRYLTEGFVFKKSEVGEADLIYSLFTKDFGRIELFAKSARKMESKFKSHLELGDFASVEFVEGKRKILTDAKLRFRPKIIKNNLLKTAVLFEICNFFDKLIKGQEPDKKIWRLLNWTIKKINSAKTTSKQSRFLFYYFAVVFLQILGYKVPPKLITRFKKIKKTS